MLNRAPYARQTTGAAVPASTTAPSKIQGMRAFNQITQFCAYLTKEHADQLLAERVLYQGKLHVFPTNYYMGSVETSIGEVIIPTRYMLNRAFDGDTVYVHIVDHNARTDAIHAWDIHGKEQAGGEVEITVSRPVGHVVYAEYSIPCQIECMLNQERAQAGHLTFAPINKQYPQIDVVQQVAKEMERNKTYNIEIREWLPYMTCPAGVLVAEGREFSLNTLDNICEYVMLQGGVPLNYKHGVDLPIEVSKQLIISEQQLCDDVALPREQVFETSDAVLLNISAYIEHLRSRKQRFDEYNRRDFTNELVFTIDPDTAKDFDDACHIRLLLADDSTVCFKDLAQLPTQKRDYFLQYFIGYEIGVHIADVTHYVKSGSILDVQAQQSTTSVYLTDRCCPMYPFELADGLCSLNPGVPRYCFSCVFRLDKAGNLLPQTVWFGKSIVLSHCRLDYVAAQEMIDGVLTADDSLIRFKERWPVARGCQRAVVLAVRHMHAVSSALREYRRELGALQLESEEIRWRVDARLHVSIQPPEVAGAAHHLIEEFMVAANCLVEMRLIYSFPGVQILRSHPPPRNDQSFNLVLSKLGMPYLDMKSGAALCRSVSLLARHIYKQTKFDEHVWSSAQQAQKLANLCFVCNNLMRANYAIGLSQQEPLFNHWGIHAQLYMHFTSPIRRYPDCICHRMLCAALAAEQREQPTDITPHVLRFREKTCLYTADVLPPRAFLRTCDEVMPMHDNAQRGAKDGTSSFAAQNGAESTALDDIEAGKHVKMGSEKEKARLQRSIDFLINYDVRLGQQSAHAAKAPVPAQESSMQSQFELIQDNMCKYAGIEVEELKAQVATCNQRAMEASQIEEMHHSAMLAIMLAKQHREYTTSGFAVSAKESASSVLIYVPAFDISFTCHNECEALAQGIVRIKNYDATLPFNKQTNDELETCVDIQMLTPIDVKLVAPEQICDPIQVWPDLAVKTVKTEQE